MSSQSSIAMCEAKPGSGRSPSGPSSDRGASTQLAPLWHLSDLNAVFPPHAYPGLLHIVLSS